MTDFEAAAPMVVGKPYIVLKSGGWMELVVASELFFQCARHRSVGRRCTVYTWSGCVHGISYITGRCASFQSVGCAAFQEVLDV